MKGRIIQCVERKIAMEKAASLVQRIFRAHRSREVEFVSAICSTSQTSLAHPLYTILRFFTYFISFVFMQKVVQKKMFSLLELQKRIEERNRRLNDKFTIDVAGTTIDLTAAKKTAHEIKLNLQLGLGFKIDLKQKGLKKFKRVNKKRAALMLQAAYRRKRAMKRVGKYLKESRGVAQREKIRTRITGAIKMQRVWRGYKVACFL
jgi:hypothetical protein